MASGSEDGVTMTRLDEHFASHRPHATLAREHAHTQPLVVRARSTARIALPSTQRSIRPRPSIQHRTHSRLQAERGRTTVLEAEWVYPRRGLTLFINPDTRKILRWAVYAPTDLATYRRRLRLQLAERELPLGE
jgi:hypothetical protein